MSNEANTEFLPEITGPKRLRRTAQGRKIAWIMAKKRFLEALDLTGTVPGACEVVNYSDGIVRGWREKDPAFRADWDAIVQGIEQRRADAIKDMEPLAIEAVQDALKDKSPEARKYRYHMARKVLESGGELKSGEGVRVAVQANISIPQYVEIKEVEREK